MKNKKIFAILLMILIMMLTIKYTMPQSQQLDGTKITNTVTQNEYTSISKSGAYFAKQLKKHSQFIKLSLLNETIDSKKICSYIIAAAFNDSATDFNNMGDYLLYNDYNGYSVKYSYAKSKKNIKYSFKFTLSYKTTYEQELEFDKKLKNVITSLHLENKTDYQKISRIYNYVCKNVSYDTIHYDDDDYDLKYTAYAALINGTAVCQGYTCLIYRMCKAASIPVRIISGESEGVSHAWNIVKIGDFYYNIDATWDSSRPYYKYFMKSNENFKNHKRDDKYATVRFNTTHPMSPYNY